MITADRPLYFYFCRNDIASKTAVQLSDANDTRCQWCHSSCCYPVSYVQCRAKHPDGICPQMRICTMPTTDGYFCLDDIDFSHTATVMHLDFPELIFRTHMQGKNSIHIV